jgi:hypothetical protein
MRKKHNEWIVGVLLIAIGLLVLLNQFIDLPVVENLAIYFVLGLGLFFLAWGVVSREPGLMVPGGILTGIGAGIALVAGPWDLGEGDLSGGVFMGAFAVGWVLITIFTALFADKTLWWPLIPAAIMALISGSLLVEGPFMFILEWLGKLWPIALIIGGIAILFGAKKVSEKPPQAAPFEEDQEELIENLKAEQ